MEGNKENHTLESSKDHFYQKQKDTPIRAKLLGAEEFCQHMGYAYSRRDLTTIFSIPNRTQKRIKQEGPRIYHSRQQENGIIDKRGRPHILSDAEIVDIEYYLKEKGKPACELPWPLLAERNGISTH